MTKLVTVRKIDAVKSINDYEIVVVDGAEVTGFHSVRDTFHAGEYCVYIEAGVSLPAHSGRAGWAHREPTPFGCTPSASFLKYRKT